MFFEKAKIEKTILAIIILFIILLSMLACYLSSNSHNNNYLDDHKPCWKNNYSRLNICADIVSRIRFEVQLSRLSTSCTRIA